MAKTTAVIDIGSNSMRMAVFKKTSRYGFYLIEEHKSKVRISENSYQNGGFLQKEAIERALSTLKGFLKIAQDLGARKILCVATSAVRDAPNKKEFLALVRSCLGLNIKIISGEKEAFYGAVAASNLLPCKEGVTIDIGGGSCECALVKSGKIMDVVSLNIGTIRLKELFFDTNKPLNEAILFIKEEIKKIPVTLHNQTIIGIGGTIRAISKAIIHKENYPLNTLHAFEYDPRQQMDFLKNIYTATTTQELQSLNIDEDRFDNIRGGALIFGLLLEHFNANHAITSGVGVREGVFLSDLLRNTHFTFPAGFNPSLRSLMDRFCMQDVRSKNIINHALKIFDILHLKHRIHESHKPHLKAAARLLNIGIALNFYQNHKHSGYFLVHGLNYGYTHKDRILISMLVESYNAKKPPLAKYEKFSSLMPNHDDLLWLNFILATAEVIGTYLQYADLIYDDNILTITTRQDPYLAKEAIEKIVAPDDLMIQIDWIND